MQNIEDNDKGSSLTNPSTSKVTRISMPTSDKNLSSATDEKGEKNFMHDL